MLYNNNFEKNLNIAIANTKIKADELHSKCIYNDIDNGRQNQILKLLSTIDNIKSMITVASDIIVPIITYHNTTYFIFLNNWKDFFFFNNIFYFVFF